MDDQESERVAERLVDLIAAALRTVSIRSVGTVEAQALAVADAILNDGIPSAGVAGNPTRDDGLREAMRQAVIDWNTNLDYQRDDVELPDVLALHVEAFYAKSGRVGVEEIPPGDDEEISEMVHVVAGEFHRVYEKQAEALGWSTQEATRVPFAHLPSENKQVMLATVGYLFGAGFIAPGPRIAGLLQDGGLVVPSPPTEKP